MYLICVYIISMYFRLSTHRWLSVWTTIRSVGQHKVNIMKENDRKRKRKRKRMRSWEGNRETGRQTDRETESQTERQRVRQTDRKTNSKLDSSFSFFSLALCLFHTLTSAPFVILGFTPSVISLTILHQKYVRMLLKWMPIQGTYCQITVHIDSHNSSSTGQHTMQAWSIAATRILFDTDIFQCHFISIFSLYLMPHLLSTSSLPFRCINSSFLLSSSFTESYHLFHT